MQLKRYRTVFFLATWVAIKQGGKMKEKIFLRIPGLLLFPIGFGVTCILCSSSTAMGIFYQYGGPGLRWGIFSDGLRKGVFQYLGAGPGILLIGYLFLCVYSMIYFIGALFMYRQDKEMGKQQVVWSLILFGVSILMVIAALLFMKASTCLEYPDGSDDNSYCAFPFLPGTKATPNS